ncbi:MAG: S-layer homology domain-containing protein, partial [Defluviitaleaceae bacterium]|nr:S-layer homology domain-containing protein [Defluviitaleaceae bacterium]
NDDGYDAGNDTDNDDGYDAGNDTDNDDADNDTDNDDTDNDSDAGNDTDSDDGNTDNDDAGDSDTGDGSDADSGTDSGNAGDVNAGGGSDADADADSGTDFGDAGDSGSSEGDDGSTEGNTGDSGGTSGGADSGNVGDSGTSGDSSNSGNDGSTEGSAGESESSGESSGTSDSLGSVGTSGASVDASGSSSVASGESSTSAVKGAVFMMFDTLADDVLLAASAHIDEIQARFGVRFVGNLPLSGRTVDALFGDRAYAPVVTMHVFRSPDGDELIEYYSQYRPVGSAFVGTLRGMQHNIGTYDAPYFVNLEIIETSGAITVSGLGSNHYVIVHGRIAAAAGSVYIELLDSATLAPLPFGTRQLLSSVVISDGETVPVNVSEHSAVSGVELINGVWHVRAGGNLYRIAGVFAGGVTGGNAYVHEFILSPNIANVASFLLEPVIDVPIPTFTVTFNSGTGTFASLPNTHQITVPAGTVLAQIPTPLAPSAGWTWIGWSPFNPVGHTVTGDITFTAAWNAPQHFLPPPPPPPPRPPIPPWIPPPRPPVLPEDEEYGDEYEDEYLPEHPSDYVPETPNSPPVVESLRFRRHFVNGYPDGLFRPDGFMTRAEMMQALRNISNPSLATLAGFTSTRFIDVSPDDWYFGTIAYLESRGVITGFPDGTIRPDAPITHAEFAAMAARFFSLSDFDFVVTSGSHWGATDINMSFAPHWLEYFGMQSNFSPDAPITRVNAVTLLNHYQGRVPCEVGINEFLANAGFEIFPDVLRSHWGFYEIAEASLSRYYRASVAGPETWTHVANIRRDIVAAVYYP